MADEARNEEWGGPWGGPWGGSRNDWASFLRGQGVDLRGVLGAMRGGFGPGGFGPGGFGPGGSGPGGHGRGTHGRHGGRGSGGRGGRGNVRAAVLALLLDRPMHGYEMIQEVEERTNGMWRPSPGSIYPTLQLLEDEGLIVSEQAEGKRRYSLTDEGRARAEQVEDVPWREHTEGFDWETINKLRSAVAQLMTAFGQILGTATDEQKAQAVEVLQETKRKLYAILAGGGPVQEEDDEG